MNQRKKLFLAPLCLAVVGFSGCDTGNPDTDKAIGIAEVAAGRSMQVGGVAVATTSPEPNSKVAGALGAGIGAALEADGHSRIRRAERRKAEQNR